MIPSFSVIIPTYNTENFIEQCIKSIANQNIDLPYEIICIDDCSTDHTVEQIGNLQKKYKNITLIQKKENSGVSESRNIGIEQAKGKYILFVDGDDFIMPNTFSVCYKMAEKYCLDLLCFNATGLTDKTCFSFIDENLLNELRKIENGCPEYLAYVTNIWLLCYRRDFLIKSNVKFSSKKVFEDWEFLWSLYSKTNRIKFVNQSLYVYRTEGNPNSLTHKVHKRTFKFQLLLDAYMDSIQEFKKDHKYSLYEYVCLQRGCEIFFHFFCKNRGPYRQFKDDMGCFSEFLHIPHPLMLEKVISDIDSSFERRILHAIYKNSICNRIILFSLLGSKAGENVRQCYESAIKISRPFKNFYKWILDLLILFRNASIACAKIFLNILNKLGVSP